MCRAVCMNGDTFYGLQTMIDSGIDIPDHLVEAAITKHIEPGDEPFDVEDCFCCVSPEVVLDGLGLEYYEDEIGDLRVVGPIF